MKTPSDPLAEALRSALDEPASPADEATVQRAIASATQALVVGAAATSAAAATGKLSAIKVAGVRLLYPLAAAASVATVGGVIWLATHDPRPREAPVPVPVPVPVAAAVSVAVTEAAPAATAEEPRPADSPTLSVDELPSAPGAASARARERATQGPITPARTAEELFREANAERRSGGIKRAEELYRALLAVYPSAPESRATRVSLGRLLLDQKGDARGALAQFDAYLQGSGDETLDEEARVGRALAFEKLGDGAEERRAWQELMQHHPGSLQSARAKRRLEALGAGSAGSASPPSE